MYAPSTEQPKLDRTREELNDVEKEIHDFFSNQQNVDKLIEYLSLEEKKGKDRFNVYRFIMFKVSWRSTMILPEIYYIREMRPLE